MIKKSRSKNPDRRKFIKNVTLASVGVALSHCTRPVKEKPNIILIVADDLGYHDLGCLGDSGVVTPNLDRLAAEGTRLTDFVTNCPVCTPSRSALLTGRYPQRNGLYDLIRNNETNYGHRFNSIEYAVSPEAILGLDTRETTFAEPLKRAGYTTGVIGKWDSGMAHRYLPLQRGFDFFYGFCNTGIDYYTHERYGVPSMFRGNEPVKEDGYATDLFKREALRFIDKNKENPFFLYLPFNAPHIASNLERDYFQVPDRYLERVPPSSDKNKMEYQAMINCLDEAIGEILGRVDQYGMKENTLVIFTSDNGAGNPGDNGPLRAGKGYLYEGGIRVPLIARWPGHLPAGSVNDKFCSMLDVFPTLMSLAGAEVPEKLKLDGKSMLPVLKGKSDGIRNEHFWEWHDKRAVRSGKWKWVRETKTKWGEADDETGELYDLSVDLGETNNLADVKPGKLAELKALWQNWKAEMDAAEPRGPFRNY